MHTRYKKSAISHVIITSFTPIEYHSTRLKNMKQVAWTKTCLSCEMLTRNGRTLRLGFAKPTLNYLKSGMVIVSFDIDVY